MSGPGVFAVASRAGIQRAVVRLSIASSALIVVILLTVYRSLPALLLGLLPVATGALAGIAAVALGFGAVHGITLGFGVTLIGESVDYSIYFFIQSAARRGRRSAPGSGACGPPCASACSPRSAASPRSCRRAFPGLAQLGAYSISGLLAAAAVTRFVLPELLPARFEIRDLTPLGARVGAHGSRPRAGRAAVPWALRARARRHALARAGARRAARCGIGSSRA